MSLTYPTLAFLGQIGPLQWVIIGIVGLLIFGKRLPEVGKSLGRGIVEFKKGLQGISDEIQADGKDGVSESKKLEDPHVHRSTGPHTAHDTSAEPDKTKSQA